MSTDGWEQRLDDLGQARELREAIARWLFARDGSTPGAWDRLLNDAGKRVWLADADALLSGPLAPLLAAQAAVERVKELAADYDDGSEWGTATHPGHAIRTCILRALDGPT